MISLIFCCNVSTVYCILQCLTIRLIAVCGRVSLQTVETCLKGKQMLRCGCFTPTCTSCAHFYSPAATYNNKTTKLNLSSITTLLYVQRPAQVYKQSAQLCCFIIQKTHHSWFFRLVIEMCQTDVQISVDSYQ